MLPIKQLVVRLTLLLVILLWLSAISLAATDKREIKGASETESAEDFVGPIAVDITHLLKDLQGDHPYTRSAAARALGGITNLPQEAIFALIKALQDDNWVVRVEAVTALGKSGRAAAKAVPEIIVAFREANYRERRFAAEAIVNISQTYLDNMNDMGRSELKEKILQLENLKVTLFKDLDQSFNPEERQIVTNLNRIIIALQAGYRSRLITTLSEWVEKYKLYEKWWVWTVAGYLVFIIFSLPTWFLLLWVRPLWLYRLNKKVSRIGFKIGYLDQPVGLHHLLLLSPFYYCQRVLDAWVLAHLQKTMNRFADLETVKVRKIHVPIPLTLNGHNIAQPSARDFLPVICKNPFCLLIWGEGGSGKTSLACQLAWWAMTGESELFLTGHLMLPILIEDDLTLEISAGQPPLLEAIRAQMGLMTGAEEISPELLRNLLRRQRILVIVDHYSELSPETRERIQPGYDPKLKINALIVTSRQEEQLQGVVTDKVKPLRIRSDRLSSFMEAYLTQLGKRELYDDAEFFTACGRLSQMVGDRNITVLLSKLYAEQMVAIKEDPSFTNLPESIPDLMLSYLNWINRHESDKNPGNRTVQRIAKVISWVNLEATFRPTDGSLAAIQRALADENDLDQKLQYLCRDLGIIQFVGPAEDKVRFSLDPLAEYLAGLHLLELYAANDGQWKLFLEEADKKEGAPMSIEGFLLAVRDCCLAKGRDYGVPSFVERELAQKTSIKETLNSRLRKTPAVMESTISLGPPYITFADKKEES